MKTTTKPHFEMQLLEEFYKRDCAKHGLVLQELYDRVERDDIMRTFVGVIERRDNDAKVKAYTEILKGSADPFALIGAALILWKVGADGDAVHTSVDTIIHENCLIEKILNLASEIGLMN